MSYRLIKSEPYKYSREQFLKNGVTSRDGVRNYQARNNLNAITLEYIKTDPKLADMMLLRQQRLSVSPVSEEEFEYIQNLGK